MEGDDDIPKFAVREVIDFSAHEKLKEIVKLRDNDWTHVHITRRALTFDGDTYNLNTELSRPMTIPKDYYGAGKSMANAAAVEEDGGEEAEGAEQEGQEGQARQEPEENWLI